MLVSESFLYDVRSMAKDAGDLSLDFFRKPNLEVEHKADGSPVTHADRQMERSLREEIDSKYPGSAIIGEEFGKQDAESSNLIWYLDPIDGTDGFARGVPLYTTLLAVEDDEGLCAGAIYAPATGEMVWAGRGLGAWTDDGPCQMSDTKSLDGAIVTTSSCSRWPLSVYENFVKRGSRIKGWGDGYGFMMAITGRVDLMIDLTSWEKPHPWDFAPIPILAKEAGGVFSNENGDENIFGSGGFCCNEFLNVSVREVLNVK